MEKERWELPVMGFKTESIVLDKWALSIRKHIAEELLAMGCQSEMDVRVVYDQVVRGVVHDIRLYLAAKKHEDTVEKKSNVAYTRVINYPLNWWEAVRERWFPQWWLKRWPVKLNCNSIDVVVNNTTTIQHTKVCPHLPTAKQPRHLNWLATSDDADERRELYRLQAFVWALYKADGMAYECSQRVRDEAKRLLEGK